MFLMYLFVFLFVCHAYCADITEMDYMSLRWRIELKCDKHDEDACCGCWIWTGGMRTDERYGTLKVAGRMLNAHRASYMAYKECNFQVCKQIKFKFIVQNCLLWHVVK